jgi:signal transduction histidine kinase
MKLKEKIIFELILLTSLIFAFDFLVDNYLFFHVIVELFSIIILFVLFFVTWNARRFLENRYLLFVGIAASFIGVLDLLHTLTYKGMNIIHSPLYYANQFWIATRFFESIVLLTGFLFVSKRLKISIRYLLVVYALITLSIILSILYFENFPTCYIDNIGQTPFKIYSEYVIIFILFTALVVLTRNKKHFEKDTYQLIATSIIFTIASEFCFTLYVANYDYINKIGHAFKVLSFFMIYKANIQNGFTRPIETFFREMKVNEERLKESHNELEKQVATRNKFFSIISHDLKNPFTVLVGYTEILLNNYSNFNDDEKKKMIKVIHATSEKTHTLLENLLVWSRAQTNSIPNHPVKFDIKEVLDENISLSNANFKEIEIERDYASEWVVADKDMVNTVIRNLLSNAIKFTPRKGKVTISARREGAFVAIGFADTGIGIPHDKVATIFNIDKTFYSKGTENETGTGLGLILCTEFVAKNRGKISVDSAPGKGSRFTFTLPASL